MSDSDYWDGFEAGKADLVDERNEAYSEGYADGYADGEYEASHDRDERAARLGGIYAHHGKLYIPRSGVFRVIDIETGDEEESRFHLPEGAERIDR